MMGVLPGHKEVRSWERKGTFGAEAAVTSPVPPPGPAILAPDWLGPAISGFLSCSFQFCSHLLALPVSPCLKCKAQLGAPAPFPISPFTAVPWGSEPALPHTHFNQCPPLPPVRVPLRGGHSPFLLLALFSVRALAQTGGCVWPRQLQDLLPLSGADYDLAPLLRPLPGTGPSVTVADLWLAPSGLPCTPLFLLHLLSLHLCGISPPWCPDPATSAGPNTAYLDTLSGTSPGFCPCAPCLPSPPACLPSAATLPTLTPFCLVVRLYRLLRLPAAPCPFWDRPCYHSSLPSAALPAGPHPTPPLRASGPGAPQSPFGLRDGSTWGTRSHTVFS
ncbi:unnamed protein product [Dicrocoelium dendriticum]|nr:unnamed protein product [Dicrocoelium dendriticum]